MRMTHSEEGRSKKSGIAGKAIPAALALAAVALGVGLIRAQAQQATPPAAPAAPAPESGTAQAGGNPPLAKAPTIRTTVEIVNVPVNALTRRGQRVIDLSLDDLKVFEDGVEQKIIYFEREARTPLRIGVILDTSSSARSRLPYEKDAAQQFVDAVLLGGGSKNQAFLETYDASSSVIQDFTNDPDVLSDKIQGLKSGGGKALYDAIYFACREKLFKTGAPEETRRILVVVSDGLDIQSQHSLDQVISMARISETMIYTVGTAAYGFANAGDKLLEELSAQTGGYSSFPLRNAPGSDIGSGGLSNNQIEGTSQNRGAGAETGRYSAERLENLVNALQAIGRDLTEQYTISYRPIRDAMDGTYRSIKVETTRAGVILRWKPGYFAKAE